MLYCGLRVIESALGGSQDNPDLWESEHITSQAKILLNIRSQTSWVYKKTYIKLMRY